ncbi:MAG: hypothetical protein HY321_06220 [Armatimonadetes bacterium]|nr:hypothetical protein [Armatimonadota bacterium]
MRVGIIGGGPAGTVCALSLLRGAARRGQRHEVLLFDGKSFLQIGPRGCNMCAGVIPATLLDRLAEMGVPVPPEVIQRTVTGHYFETLAGGVHVPKDPDAKICTVFRSAGPRGSEPLVDQSFDQLLLGGAQAAGAVHIHSHVTEVALPSGADAPFRLRTTDGGQHEVDVVVGAFGVNSALARRFERLGFGYRRPGTYQACQADLPVDDRFLEERHRGEIRIFSLALPGIRFGALTPKRRHVTVTVIGPRPTRADLERFLNHPRVRHHFPEGWELPLLYCTCHPWLPVTAARSPVADRLLVIGDANISRYLKGGIESAFFTGALAAEMILSGRLSRAELVRGYVRPCHARYRYDNLYGRVLFAANDLISRLPLVARAGLWLVDREQRIPDWRARRHTRLLWHIFTGDAPYRRIAREALDPRSLAPALWALLLSAAGRVRRHATE